MGGNTRPPLTVCRHSAAVSGRALEEASGSRIPQKLYTGCWVHVCISLVRRPTTSIRLSKYDRDVEKATGVALEKAQREVCWLMGALFVLEDRERP